MRDFDFWSFASGVLIGYLAMYVTIAFILTRKR